MPGPTSGRLNLNPRWPFWDTSKFAAAVDAAAAPRVYDKTGFATVGLVGSGPKEFTFQKSGAGIAGLVGSGPWERGWLTAKFELGTDAATISTGDTGNDHAWDGVFLSGTSSAVYDITRQAHGAQSMKVINAGGGQALIYWNTKFSSKTDHYGRLYVLLTANPSVGGIDIVRANLGATLAAMVSIFTDGRIVVTSSTGAVLLTTAAVSLNKWVRIEYHMTHNTSTGLVEAKLFNNAESTTPTETVTLSGANTLASADGIVFGNYSAAANGPYWVDAIAAKASAYPGPDTSPVISSKRNAGLVGGVGSGVSQFVSGGGVVYTKTGFATAGLVGAGGSASVYTKTGYATVGLVGAGVRAVDHIRTGFATAGLVGAGPSASVFAKAGFATAGGIGTGADADLTQETGFAVAGLVGSGASSSVFTRTGLAVVGLVASGPSESVFVEAGSGSVNTVGAAPSESLTQETGFATVGSVGAGFITRAGQIVKTGAGACGLVGAGTSASIFQRAGNAIAGTVATGSRARELTRTGLGQIGTVASGVALRAATSAKAGFGTVAGTALGASASLVQRLGNAVAGLVGSGSETRTSGAVTAKTGAGAAGTVGSGPSASIYGRAGSASAALIARGARAVIYIQGGYAIVSGTGSGVRVRTITKTGIGYLGVSGYGDNTEHFDPERPGHIVGSHTGQPNHSTTGHQTASIATILATGRNGRLTRSKTGELV